MSEAAAGTREIRPAAAADLARIQAIYAHHVIHGRASFEELAPDLDEMTRRFEALRAGGFPYLVASVAGGVVAYAYAGPFRPRAAYRHTVEDSVYVAPEAVGQGHGRALLAALVAQCETAGFRQMVAVLGDASNEASIRLHEGAGFRRAGQLTAVGRKHGRWLDVVLMQRPLGAGDGPVPDG